MLQKLSEYITYDFFMFRRIRSSTSTRTFMSNLGVTENIFVSVRRIVVNEGGGGGVQVGV